MTGTSPGDLLSWLLTYAIHSSVLLGAAWLATRARRITPAAAEILWKAALIGGFFTASLQLWLDLRPAGSVALGAQEQRVSVAPAARVATPVGQLRVNEPSLGVPEAGELRALLAALGQVPRSRTEAPPYVP